MKRFLQILGATATIAVLAIVALLIAAVIYDNPSAPCSLFAMCTGAK